MILLDKAFEPYLKILGKNCLKPEEYEKIDNVVLLFDKSMKLLHNPMKYEQNNRKKWN